MEWSEGKLKRWSWGEGCDFLFFSLPPFGFLQPFYHASIDSRVATPRTCVTFFDFFVADIACHCVSLRVGWCLGDAQLRVLSIKSW